MARRRRKHFCVRFESRRDAEIEAGILRDFGNKAKVKRAGSSWNVCTTLRQKRHHHRVQH